MFKMYFPVLIEYYKRKNKKLMINVRKTTFLIHRWKIWGENVIRFTLSVTRLIKVFYRLPPHSLLISGSLSQMLRSVVTSQETTCWKDDKMSFLRKLLTSSCGPPKHTVWWWLHCRLALIPRLACLCRVLHSLQLTHWMCRCWNLLPFCNIKAWNIFSRQHWLSDVWMVESKKSEKTSGITDFKPITTL